MKMVERRVYARMIERCTNENNISFKHYAARGITVCDRWLESFENFYADMGPRPPGVSSGGRAVWSLDRIDNDGGYEPGNCRWATQSQQNRNRRGARADNFLNPVAVCLIRHMKRRGARDVDIAHAFGVGHCTVWRHTFGRPGIARVRRHDSPKHADGVIRKARTR